MRLNNSCKDYAEITKFTTTERRIHPKGELKKEIKEKKKKRFLGNQKILKIVFVLYIFQKSCHIYPSWWAILNN